MDTTPDARSARYDAGWYLRELPTDQWNVVRDVPIGTDEIPLDWLAIGPAGVYAITGKDHRSHVVRVGNGRILVDGRATDYLRRAKRQATWIHALLSEAVDRSFWATPVIAIMSDVLQIRAQPGSVHVLEPASLPSWLSSQPSLFTTDEVQRLVLTVDTWVKVNS